MDIPRPEFEARQAAAREEARTRGLGALLVWSRMGTDLYWYGDVMYLTNQHSALGDFQDAPGWFGRGYNVLLLPVDGDPALVVDLPDYDRSSVHVDDIRFTLDVPRAVAEVLREKRLERDKLGLVGRQTLLASSRDAMEAHLGTRLELVAVDDIVEDLRMIKSDAEIALMRNAGEVGAEAMRLMMEAVEPGRTEGEVVGEGLRFLAANQAVPYDVAVTSGDRSHLYWNLDGPPHWDSIRALERGDLIHIDLWGPVSGYYTDFARSTVVGGSPAEHQLELLEAPLKAVPVIGASLREGETASSVFAVGERWMKDAGWLDKSISLADDPTGAGPLHEHCPIFGHGIGMSNERPWLTAGDSTPIRPGMVIAVEVILARGSEGAYLEHDFLVGRDGVEALDAACPERWW